MTKEALEEFPIQMCYFHQKHETFINEKSINSVTGKEHFTQLKKLINHSLFLILFKNISFILLLCMCVF